VAGSGIGVGRKRLAGSWQGETIKDQRATTVVGRVLWGMPDNAWYKDREGVRRQFVWETWGGMRRT
jgi:hypothetical protein